jgi:putative hemolysin
LASEGRYEAKIAGSAEEVKSALRLRFEVFKVEMAGLRDSAAGLEFDEYDFRCKHLIVRDKETGQTVGTYRLATVDGVSGTRYLYSNSEFTIEDLPADILKSGIEIGRACVAKEHRNTKVLFLLWKGLAKYLLDSGKRYFFGCCSIFSTDIEVGRGAYHTLSERGNVNKALKVSPRRNAINIEDPYSGPRVNLPSLFEMYLRLGAKVCGAPMVDNEFGTIDFFVVLDMEAVPEKYRRMFFN